MAKRRSEATWQALFRKFEQSGLSATKFCEGEGIPAGYFSKKYRQQSKSDGSNKFSPVRISPSVPLGSVRVQIGDVSIRCDGGVSPGWLAEVIAALR